MMSGSIAAGSILATTPGGLVVGAAWDEDVIASGLGRLSILMDVDWFQNANSETVVDNLQTFLSVPEPASLMLLGAATLLMPCRRRH
jgi:hypothetical protein